MSQEQDIQLFYSSSMLAPPGRFVIVAGYWEDDQAGFEIVPVVAIESRATQDFRPTSHSRKPTVITANSLADFGWRSSGPRVEYHYVVFYDAHGEFPILCSAAEAFDVINGDWRAVRCDWPPEEDESRLKPIADDVIRYAEKKVMFRRNLTAKSHPRKS